MAKTIKFNLILNGESIRNLEGLKNNFSIEDILEVYFNGLLNKWLYVRGYDNHLEKVRRISSERNRGIIEELIRIFEIESDSEKIRESLQILDFKNAKKFLLDKYETLDFRAQSIIDEYHSGYSTLIGTIIENKDNMPEIKSCVNKIEESYIHLFKFNYYELFQKLIEVAPKAIFVFLMNDSLRNYYAPPARCFENSDLDQAFLAIGELYSNEGIFSDITGMKVLYNELLRMMKKDWLKRVLNTDLKSFRGHTDGYWRDVEPEYRRFLILSAEPGNYVRNSGAYGHQISSDILNSGFIITNGIDYKSNNENHELLYLEV